MAKDYAKVTKKKQQSSHWGMKVLLAIGVFVGGYIAASYYDFNTLRHKVAQKVNKVLPEKSIKPIESAKQEKPLVLPKPKFEFYTILPKQKVTEAKPVAKVQEQAPKHEQVVKSPSGKQYVLQVASFKRVADADKLKAQLILKGFDVKIVEFSNGRNTWYRVTLGPYNTLDSVVKTQSQLASETKMNGMVKRIA